MFVPAEPEAAIVFNCLPTASQASPIPAVDLDRVTSVTKVEELMKKFSDELGQFAVSTDEFLASERPQIVRVQAAAQLAAFAGGSIIKIHPFVNGNGRIARLAMNFFLHRYLNRVPFFIDRPNNPDYSTASGYAMQTGNFVPLYQYVVELLAISL